MFGGTEEEIGDFSCTLRPQYILIQTLLTINIESDSFADCGWNAIVCQTEVDTGIEAAHVA